MPHFGLSSQEPVTITVRSLRAQHDGAEILIRVMLESGERREQKSLPLTVEQYYELKPMRGVISEEQYELLEEASTLCSAIRCGETLLSYGSNSAQLLSQKITRHGFRREVAMQAAQVLRERGLINEAQDLERVVEKCLRKLWGSKRIQAHLWNRGFAGDTMQRLPELLFEVNFIGNCEALIRKHYGEVPQELREQKRMIASLARYGYSLSEIQTAIANCKNRDTM